MRPYTGYLDGDFRGMKADGSRLNFWHDEGNGENYDPQARGIRLIGSDGARAVSLRIESSGYSRIGVRLIQPGGWRKEASLDDQAPLSRPS